MPFKPIYLNFISIYITIYLSIYYSTKLSIYLWDMMLFKLVHLFYIYLYNYLSKYLLFYFYWAIYLSMIYMMPFKPINLNFISIYLSIIYMLFKPVHLNLMPILWLSIYESFILPRFLSIYEIWCFLTNSFEFWISYIFITIYLAGEKFKEFCQIRLNLLIKISYIPDFENFWSRDSKVIAKKKILPFFQKKKKNKKI